MLKEPMPLLTVWTSCVQYFGGGDRGGQSSQSGRPLYYFTHSHNEFIKKKIIRKKKAKPQGNTNDQLFADH